jgi:hypothetical protein
MGDDGQRPCESSWRQARLPPGRPGPAPRPGQVTPPVAPAARHAIALAQGESPGGVVSGVMPRPPCDTMVVDARGTSARRPCVRRHETFGCESACERRHRRAPRARRTDKARRAHGIPRPPRLRGATRHRRLHTEGADDGPPGTADDTRGGRALLGSCVHRMIISQVRGSSRRRRIATVTSWCSQSRSHVVPGRRAPGDPGRATAMHSVQVGTVSTSVP